MRTRIVEADGGEQPTRLAEILRAMRKQAGVSQLELALRLGVSQRHLSFVEIARARPSRSLLLAWIEELDAPISLCNAALLHAGYPPLRASPGAMDDDDPRRLALEGLERAHEPYPAIVFDPDWYALSITRGGWELSLLLAADLPDSIANNPRGHDMIASIGHPEGLLKHALEPEVMAAAFLNQFKAEAWARPQLRERTHQCELSLKARFGSAVDVPGDLGATHLQRAFKLGDEIVRFFTIQAVVGLPQNVSTEALRAELWFPEDAATRRFMEKLAEAGGDEPFTA